MSKAQNTKGKPDKILIELLERENFIEPAEGEKPPLPKLLPSKISKDDKTTAEITSEGRR